MYLLIDNSDTEKISLWFCKDVEWVENFFLSSVGVLGAIVKGLENKGLKITSLRGLAVVVGQGRFTATRVATTVVNSLALALNIPVVAVPKVNLSGLIKKIMAAPVGQYVLPVYSGEANIGPKKITHN